MSQIEAAIPLGLRCPNCESKDIVPSLPRGLVDAFLAKWGTGRIPRHCRHCGRRFYQVLPPKQPSGGGE